MAVRQHLYALQHEVTSKRRSDPFLLVVRQSLTRELINFPEAYAEQRLTH
jgi:hypothetical protein